MSSFQKPAKLVLLNLYYPYQPRNRTQHVISRDNNRIRNNDEKQSFRTSQPLMNTCVKSFI